MFGRLVRVLFNMPVCVEAINKHRRADRMIQKISKTLQSGDRQPQKQEHKSPDRRFEILLNNFIRVATNPKGERKYE